ncbi:MAG: methionyl-tRNA formyltransferase [Gammaproteobacteria bacterium]|nr:methionyl-tRNA formyltransferase [Gammaproteobacteria bacterium]MYD76292.1 methionyl-tRNA formyltransferase [Gammaproteobacteria bacterium]MYJ51330.1 methionyl-tRNA formyltransferase [Gammaproteobacteria bacterium]
MKIVVHGQQAFGRAVLERLLEGNENVVAVCTAPDREGRPVDPLKELALERGLPVHQPSSWKTPESLDLMRSFEADLCMMAYVLLFVPEAVINAPRLGSFQYHPSLLPMHRGPSSINWPISMGATETGLTIFWPDDGLDEGPILLQKTCSIGPDETLGDVYFKKLFPMGVDAMIESLELVKAGRAPRIGQNLDEGSYESWFGRDQARLDWSESAARVYNVIRASNPQPGAWTMHGNAVLRIFDSERSGRIGRPGEVLGIDDDGITVAAADGAICIKRVRSDGGKIPASQYARDSGLAVGEVLGG